jgi:hypothetical protein
MTEKEWTARNDLRQMLETLRGKASGRKLRLFAVAGCRQQGKFMAARLRRDVVAAAEAYADDESDGAALQAAGIALRQALHISNPIATHLTHPDSELCARSIVAPAGPHGCGRVLPAPAQGGTSSQANREGLMVGDAAVPQSVSDVIVENSQKKKQSAEKGAFPSSAAV